MTQKSAFEDPSLKAINIPSLCIPDLDPKPSSESCNVYDQSCEPQETKDDIIPPTFKPTSSRIQDKYRSL